VKVVLEVLRQLHWLLALVGLDQPDTAAAAAAAAAGCGWCKTGGSRTWNEVYCVQAENGVGTVAAAVLHDLLGQLRQLPHQLNMQLLLVMYLRPATSPVTYPGISLCCCTQAAAAAICWLLLQHLLLQHCKEVWPASQAGGVWAAPLALCWVYC
jgi:hypothetical protein